VEHERFVHPANIIKTLRFTANMGDMLTECHHVDDLPVYVSLLEQCVRFAIPKLMETAAADAGILLFRSVGPVVPAVVLEEPVALEELVVPAVVLEEPVALEEPVVPAEARRSKRLRE